MKSMNGYIALFILVLLAACAKEKTNFQALKAIQDYSLPVWQDNEINKSALFIFPHPDDEIVCAGTIDQLKKNGWTVSLLTMTKGVEGDKEMREAEWKNSMKALHVDNSEIMDIINNTWEKVTKNEIEFWYTETDSTESMVYSQILKYKPSVVFSYDTAFGGYGHPEHRMSAKAVNNVFQKHKGDSTFTVKHVYQITLPETVEQAVLGANPAVKVAMQVTGNKTLPDPTIAFDITKNWSTKRKAGLTYPSQVDILRKFFLLPNDADTVEHYATFSREYFYEIK